MKEKRTATYENTGVHGFALIIITPPPQTIRFPRLNLQTVYRRIYAHRVT